MTKPEYAQTLKGERWQAMRRLVIEASSYCSRCQINTLQLRSSSLESLGKPLRSVRSSVKRAESASTEEGGSELLAACFSWSPADTEVAQRASGGWQGAFLRRHACYWFWISRHFA